MYGLAGAGAGTGLGALIAAILHKDPAAWMALGGGAGGVGGALYGAGEAGEAAKDILLPKMEDKPDPYLPDTLKKWQATMKNQKKAAAVYAVRELAGGMLLKSALEVKDREPLWKRPVSGTVGRIPGLLTMAIGTTAPLRHSPTAQDFKDLIAAYKDAPEGDEVELQLGSSRPLHNLARIWKRKQMGVTGKLLGTLGWLPREAIPSVMRADNYDPYSNRVVVYNKDKAIAAHELGHSQDYGTRRRPTLHALSYASPWGMLAQEAEASDRGIRLLRDSGADDKEINRAQRVLGGGMGTYIASLLAPASPLSLPVGAIAGQIAGRIAKPFDREGRKDKTKEKPELKVHHSEAVKAKAASRILLKLAEGGTQGGESIESPNDVPAVAVNQPSVGESAMSGGLPGAAMGGVAGLLYALHKPKERRSWLSDVGLPLLLGGGIGAATSLLGRAKPTLGHLGMVNQTTGAGRYSPDLVLPVIPQEGVNSSMATQK
jgi:hypothetical protein